MRLTVDPGSGRLPVSTRFIKTVAEKTLQRVKGAAFAQRAEISVVFAGTGRVQRLNRQWRGRNRPTDVLAFSLMEGKRFPVPSGGYIPLGDVVICTPVAKRQAKELGNPFKNEAALLLIHGILHLLGYDHVTVAQERKMFTLQDALIKKMREAWS
jgi:probable rRNA maturation factor